MKRSNLKRTGWMRGPRKRMKSRATPARIYYASVKPDREAWAQSQRQRCMVCHGEPNWIPLQVHEIERRSHAPGRWWHRCNALLVCNACHAGPLATMAHAQQLAIKAAEDAEHYSLKAWLSIGTRPASYVTEYEVAEWMRKHQGL